MGSIIKIIIDAISWMPAQVQVVAKMIIAFIILFAIMKIIRIILNMIPFL